MRKVLLIVLFLAGFIFSQDETYEFPFSNFSTAPLGFAVMDDGRIAIFNEDLRIFNQYGSLLSVIDISPPPFYENIRKIFQTDLIRPSSEGGLYIIGDNNTFYTLDSELNITSSISLNYRQPRAFHIVDDDIILLDGDGHNYKLVKLTKSNSVLTEYEFEFNFGYSQPMAKRIKISESGNILVSSYVGRWILFNKDLEEIYRNEGQKMWFTDFIENDRIITFGSKKYQISGIDGLLIRESDYGPVHSFMRTITYNKGLIYYFGGIYLDENQDTVRQNHLAVIDTNGNIISRTPVEGVYRELKADDYIYAIGNNSRLKVDKAGNLSVLYFEEMERSVLPGDTLLINYYSGIQDSKLILSYIDSLGQNTLISEVSSTDSVYLWIAPEEPKPGCQLKIALKDNPQKFDLHLIDITMNTRDQFIDANNIIAWTNYGGIGGRNPDNKGAGLYWPGEPFESPYSKLPGIPAVFCDGPILGYQKNEFWYAHGCSYCSGFVAGKFDHSGTPTTRYDTRYLVYKVWSDSGNLNSQQKLENRYARKNWPVDDGAPWIDNNNDGYYDPLIDEPDIPGNQLLWSTYITPPDDTTYSHFGSPPDKIEVHSYLFDINDQQLEDVIFRRFKIINKSTDVLDSVYFGYWSDPDLGHHADDFAGCSPELNLGYVYNGDNDDDDFYKDAPPAIGYQIVQGPLEESEKGIGIKNGEPFEGYKNLPLTSFTFYVGGDEVYSDLNIGEYEGTKMCYNNLRGLRWDGDVFIDPNTGEAEKLLLSGDPASGEGWYEGPLGWPAGKPSDDRRFLMSSGPFTMEPGDTQDVVYAIMLARGADNIDSITELRKLAGKVSSYYNNNQIFRGEEKPSILPVPDNYTLYQNYPNPFNPATTITFDLAEPGDVKLEIFNILGQKINTYVKRGLAYGTHFIRFDGSGLASGIYIYRIESGSFTATKKMILLK